ncbi:unnamed protein product, partial [Rotaria socialis]
HLVTRIVLSSPIGDFFRGTIWGFQFGANDNLPERANHHESQKVKGSRLYSAINTEEVKLIQQHGLIYAFHFNKKQCFDFSFVKFDRANSKQKE